MGHFSCNKLNPLLIDISFTSALYLYVIIEVQLMTSVITEIYNSHLQCFEIEGSNFELFVTVFVTNEYPEHE